MLYFNFRLENKTTTQTTSIDYQHQPSYLKRGRTLSKNEPSLHTNNSILISTMILFLHYLLFFTTHFLFLIRHLLHLLSMSKICITTNNHMNNNNNNNNNTEFQFRTLIWFLNQWKKSTNPILLSISCNISQLWCNVQCFHHTFNTPMLHTFNLFLFSISFFFKFF